ncbi:MAG TPA: hypothetical protein VK629_01380 [Steroidobacteraceae bacterium]|nr:hypothetical protein [Steroidobacteraceae bacterium]
MIAALCAGVGGVSSGAMAADVGVGVSFRSTDSTIYVPIDISKFFRVEPLIRFSQSKVTDNTFGFENEQRMTSYSVGTGLFGLHPLGDSVVVYYGGRFAYIRAKTEAANVVVGAFGPYVQQFELRGDGFSFAPTLGMEYRFAEHFSVGAEAALTYTDLDFESDVNSTTGSETTSTTTNIIFRYRF